MIAELDTPELVESVVTGPVGKLDEDGVPGTVTELEVEFLECVVTGILEELEGGRVLTDELDGDGVPDVTGVLEEMNEPEGEGATEEIEEPEEDPGMTGVCDGIPEATDELEGVGVPGGGMDPD